ncbi:MAG: pyridoxamine 5'-phosphate oxidase family protein [Porphyromonadaceae bacterium]|nr:pyridoxamine 5'-phosphate oxidase family protein [Porphyromonadaceae bacterium]
MRTSFITEQEEIDKIILECQYCFVGITDEDGSPYVLPMNFGYAEGKIILHSDPNGRHVRLLEKDSRVCVTFCTSNNKIFYQHRDVACSYSMESKSVLCRGKIQFIEDMEEKERLMKLFMKHYTEREFSFSVPAIRNVKIWLLEPEKVTAKAFGQNYRYKDNFLPPKV